MRKGSDQRSSPVLGCVGEFVSVRLWACGSGGLQEMRDAALGAFQEMRRASGAVAFFFS